MFARSKKLNITHLIMILAFVFPLAACAAKENTPAPVSLQQQLRLSNTGSTDIKGLVLYFPGLHSEAEVVKLDFGDLAAGQTSTYLDVPSGVYAYAAYAYKLDGREIVQPVTDWVGEAPIAGKKFTYQITLDLKKIEGAQMRLVKVLVDEK